MQINSKRIRVYVQIHLGNNMCLPKAWDGHHHHMSVLWVCWVWARGDPTW